MGAFRSSFARYLSKRCPASFSVIWNSFIKLLYRQIARIVCLISSFLESSGYFSSGRNLIPSSRDSLCAFMESRRSRNGSQSGKNLDGCFETVSSENLLTFPLHESYVNFRITAISDNSVSTNCKCVNVCTFLIESHVHFIRHGKFAGMFMNPTVYRCFYLSGSERS